LLIGITRLHHFPSSAAMVGSTSSVITRTSRRGIKTIDG
jgi:hypothetical protein